MAGERFDRCEQGGGPSVEGPEEDESAVDVGYAELPAGTEDECSGVQDRVYFLNVYSIL